MRLLRPVLVGVTCASLATSCKFFTFRWDQPDCTTVAGWHFYWMDAAHPPTLGSDMPIAQLGQGCGLGLKNSVDMECVAGGTVTTWMTSVDATGSESVASNVVTVVCP